MKIDFQITHKGVSVMDTKSLKGFRGYDSLKDAVTIAASRIKDCNIPTKQTRVIISFRELFSNKNEDKKLQTGRFIRRTTANEIKGLVEESN